MKTLQEYADELILRWNAPMPGFFRPIYRVSLALLALSASLVFLGATLTEYGIVQPGWLSIVTGVAGAVGTVITKLTVDWNAKRTADKVNRLQSPTGLGWLLVGTYLGRLLGYGL